MPTPRELFFQYVAQTSPTPLAIEIAHAEGVYLYTPEGKKMIDLISGIAVSNVGHRHPKVQQAVENQLNKYWHVMVYGELIQSPQNELAYQLCQTLPAHLNNVYFTNSGSEAIEGAMKLAKRFTQRTQILSCYNAYHGSSQGALSISGSEKFKQAYRPLLPDIQHIHYGSFSDLNKITERTAAVFIETIQGEAGVKIACTNYFQALQQRCHEVGALLVLDEIQTGFGRTGRFWAFEHFDIQPDILVCAKGMGGGMPIGAFISSKEVMQVLTYHPILGHITTFGGHPVSCAASLATLQVIQSENLLPQVAPKAELFRTLLKHPKILDFRNIGLMIALEFEDFATLKPIIDKALQLGVLTDWFLYCDHAMRIAPPLTLTEEQIHEACQIILQAIEEA